MINPDDGTVIEKLIMEDEVLDFVQDEPYMLKDGEERDIYIQLESDVDELSYFTIARKGSNVRFVPGNSPVLNVVFK